MMCIFLTWRKVKIWPVSKEPSTATFENLSETFGVVLKRFRKTNDLSQMKLAMEAGMHLNALGNLERGVRNPSLRTVFLLCAALKVSAGDFIAAIEAEQKKPLKRRMSR